MTLTPGNKLADATINKTVATVIALVLLIAFGWPIFQMTVNSPRFIPTGDWSLPLLLGMIIVIGSIHELIHAAGFMIWGKVSPNRFKFGFMWKAMAMYCHCKDPVTVRTFRVASLLPLLVLGPISVIFLFALPSLPTAFATVFSIVGATGDVMVYLKLRNFDADLIAKDHPVKVGLEIYESANPDVQG